MREHNILIAGSFGDFAGKVIRIGHMGENANTSDMTALFAALDEVLRSLNVPVAVKMDEYFTSCLRKIV